MRNFGLLEFLMIILSLLVLLAIFVVIIAIVFPSSTAQIISHVREDPELRESAPVKIISKISERGSRGFNARIKPSMEYMIGLFTRERGLKIEKEAKAEPAPPPDIDFSTCLAADCHPDLFERKVFNNIYVDHGLHQAESIDCFTCHRDDKHPDPKVVKQEVCLECHKEKNAVTGCGGCHTPGSILSNEVIVHTTIEEFLAGRISPSIVPNGFEHPVGDRNNICRNCHIVPDFCNKCHEMFHKQIANWVPTHGGRIINGELPFSLCWNCHNANWCATTCHSNAPSKARRTVPPLKLPRVPLPE